MNRRKLLASMGAASSSILVPRFSLAEITTPRPSPVRWGKSESSPLFSSLACDGVTKLPQGSTNLLNAFCKIYRERPKIDLTPGSSSGDLAPLKAELKHRLCDSGKLNGEDLLEATLAITNTSDKPQQVEFGFLSKILAGSEGTQQSLYAPLSAAGLSRDKRFGEMGASQFIQDCNITLERGVSLDGHYLEPMASDPAETETRAPLLVPVVDISHASSPWHLALFTGSEEAMRYRTAQPEGRTRSWNVGRVATIPASGTLTQRCWLLAHRGDASVAWDAFRKFGHRNDYAPIDWVQNFRVHYYDFLSPADGKGSPRGDGFEAALPHFREFRVGLATQHGYYQNIGEFIHPDRKEWMAMQGDKAGPVKMSLDIMRRRIRETRTMGSKAGIYMHTNLYDDQAPELGDKLDAVMRTKEGKLRAFPWQGPDMKGSSIRMSIASEQWSSHLLQQADNIMSILKPDAIIVDETFAGLGYEHHPDRPGPTSHAAIQFFKRLHALVRSYGDDKAVLMSDCSMSNFILWADGECGDHAYPSSLGNPLYSQSPVRYLAALGDKPWRPCAWHFRHMWDLQMKLARQTGAGVGVANGWADYTGLHGLKGEERHKIITDIRSLV